MLEINNDALPVFVSVTVFLALVVPTTTLPNPRLVVERETL